MEHIHHRPMPWPLCRRRPSCRPITPHHLQINPQRHVQGGCGPCLFACRVAKTGFARLALRWRPLGQPEIFFRTDSSAPPPQVAQGIGLVAAPALQWPPMPWKRNAQGVFEQGRRPGSSRKASLREFGPPLLRPAPQTRATVKLRRLAPRCAKQLDLGQRRGGCNGWCLFQAERPCPGGWWSS